MSNSTEQAPSNRVSIVRWFLIFLGLCLFGCILFFGSKFLYGFGQRTAEQIAGVDKTLTSIPTNTLTPIPPTLTITPTVGPSPTATDFVIIPTATATVIPWTQCPGIVVTVNDTEKGDILHIKRCEDGFEYDIGPLTKGAFAVSPDNKYLVYAGVNGILYGAKIGDTTLYTIKNLKKEGPFVTFGKKVTPIFRLKFVGDAPPYVLDVYEAQYLQNFPVRMPSWLSQ